MESSQAQATQALEDAVADLCAELRHNYTLYALHFRSQLEGLTLVAARSASRGPLPDIWAAVLETAYPIIQAQARLFNASHSSTAQLAPELLCAILELLPFRDKISTSHVCHAWRDLSLSNPRQIWSNIPTCRSPRMLSALLERAASCPVSVEVQSLCDVQDEEFDTLMAHMSHIRSLHVDFYNSPDQGWYRNFPADLLRSPAPALEGLELADYDPEGNGITFNGSTFSGNSPFLRHVALYDIHCDFATAPLANVRSFVYHYEKGQCSYGIVTLSPILISAVFSCCPRAESISLATAQFDFDSESADNGQVICNPPAGLKRLALSNWSFGVPASLLSRIAHTNIPELAVWPRGAEQFSELLSTFSQYPAAHVDLHICVYHNHCFRTLDIHGRYRIYIDVQDSVFAPCCARILAGITSLTISGELSDVVTTLPTMESLQHLTIICVLKDVPCSTEEPCCRADLCRREYPCVKDYPCEKASTRLIDAFPRGKSLECKALEVVTFTTPKGGDRPTSGDVLAFVEQKLVFERHKLRQLRFQGRSHQPHAEEARCQLLAIADTVIYEGDWVDTEWWDMNTLRKHRRVG